MAVALLVHVMVDADVDLTVGYGEVDNSACATESMTRITTDRIILCEQNLILFLEFCVRKLVG